MSGFYFESHASSPLAFLSDWTLFLLNCSLFKHETQPALFVAEAPVTEKPQTTRKPSKQINKNVNIRILTSVLQD